MSKLWTTLVQAVDMFSSKAEQFIGRERDYAASQNLLNHLLFRYVVEKVSFLQDLHAEVHDGWLRLFATIDKKGVYAQLSVDLKLIEMKFNPDQQLVVFEQISNTRVIQAQFDAYYKKIGAYTALWFFHSILGKDPLGTILQHFEVVNVQYGLLYLDLNRWLGDVEKVMTALEKAHIHHGILQKETILLIGNLNVAGFFNSNHIQREVIFSTG